MTREFRMTILFSVLLISHQLIAAQTRGTPAPNATAPAQPQAPKATQSVQPQGPQATPPAQPQAPNPTPTPQPQAGRRGTPPKPQPPLTLRQVIESLLALKNSARVESLVAARGIQFQSSPAVL